MAGGSDADDVPDAEPPEEDRPTNGGRAEPRREPGSLRPCSRAGEVIDGRWRLVALLGSGGMSNVYRAEHVPDGRAVAVKLLLPELASSALYARRVLREGRAANAVSHPNVVRVEEIGIDANGAPYLVQEFLSGMDLWDYAATQRGIIRPEQLIPWIVPVLDALATFHEAGILHRDIKPSNVFLVMEDDGWSPRLLDFGLASLTGYIELPRITTSDVTLGTPAYMSPEQIRDPRDLTPRSDLWSVGVMLYEMLTGVLPFRSDNVGTFVIAINTELPVPMRRRAPWLSSGLCNAVMQCLEKDPRHRPASARALITALTTARNTTAPPPAMPDDDPVIPVKAALPSNRVTVDDDQAKPARYSRRVKEPPEPEPVATAPEPEPATAAPEAGTTAAADDDPGPTTPVAEPVPPAATVAEREPALDVAGEAPPAESPRSRWWIVTVAVTLLSVLAWLAAYGLPDE